MASGLIIVPNFMPALDTNAEPLSGAKIEFFLEGTTTQSPVFTDTALTVEASNPVVADASGRFAPVYGALGQNYTAKVMTSGGTTIEVFDRVTAIGTGSLSATLDASTYNTVSRRIR